MTISTRQRIAMAIIIAVGVLAGAGVLLSDRRAPEDETSAASADTERPAPAPHEVRIDEARLREAGVTVRAAGPGSLRSTASFPGEVRFDEDRTAHVVPRLAGVAEAVPAKLGEVVRRGQLLAVIASTTLSEQRSELLTAQRRREAAQLAHDREKTLRDAGISAAQDFLQAQTALQEADIALRNARQKLAAIGANGPVASGAALNRFEIRAPFDGTVVEKHLALGEAVKDDASIFTVADLRTVWAEFAVSPNDLATVRVGQKAIVSSSAFDGRVEGTVSYVGALLGEQTRTARARVTLANPQGAWRPGLFVTVTVLGEARPAPLVVDADALQTVDGKPVVFKAMPGGFVATPVEVGRRDDAHVEVLRGLQAGDAVASSNTFVLKAELGKSGVEEE